MSVSYSCPGCAAQIEVPDDAVDKEVQCPHCDYVFAIPPATENKPIIVANPVEAPPLAAPRRPRSETRPRGPLWPWLVVVPCMLIIGGLLLSSCGVLFIWRKPAPRHPGFGGGVIVVNGQRVHTGRLEGRIATLSDGVFQVRTELVFDDPADRGDPRCRVKQYEIELRAGLTYQILVESNQFDCMVRLEQFGQVLRRDGRLGVRNAQFTFRPERTETYNLFVTSVDPNFGSFTLTVREQPPK